ncbi:MAG: hypothetical protein ACT4QF_25470 [Sporichthyaceae bacterium]
MELNDVERDWELSMEAARKRWVRAGYTAVEFFRKVKVDRGLPAKIAKGQSNPTDDTLDRIEGGLGLPIGFLARVADHDVEWIQRRVEDHHLRDWLLDEIASKAQQTG